MIMKFAQALERMWIISGLQIFTFMILADFAFTLRDVKIIVPTAVRRGENVNLICQYELEPDETLYSMKWYKGKREFFRYTPKENPPWQQFPVPGISVDTQKTNRTFITLRSVEPSISGKYVCEISADAPSFHTEIVSSEMEVVVVPQNQPVITGIRSHYRIGELIRGNCSSQYSRPASNLTWLMNDKPVVFPIRQYPTIKDESRNLLSNTVGIMFRLDSEHFAKNGRLKIECIASLYDLYRESIERFVEEERPTVLSASASQAMMEKPSHFSSSYHEDSENRNDAHVQNTSNVSTSSVILILIAIFFQH